LSWHCFVTSLVSKYNNKAWMGFQMEVGEMATCMGFCMEVV
jgi:hypothetical protein